MPQGLHGLTDATFESLILDAGACYFNIDLTELESGAHATFEAAIAAAIATAEPVGATRGGSSFNANRELREIEADGQLGATRGLVRRTTVRPTLTVNFLEQTVGNLRRQLPGAIVEQAGLWSRITGGPITNDTYVDNVAIVTTYGEEGKYFVIVVENALVMNSPDFQTQDKDEVATGVEFVGCFAGVNADEPWRKYLPPTESS
jgi:hypothetical protein